jgi:hypothetical protein
LLSGAALLGEPVILLEDSPVAFDKQTVPLV